MTKEELEIDLVIARLEMAPKKLYFSMGGSESMSKNDLIKHIKDNDDIGRGFVNIELEFLRALKSGELMRQLTQ